MRTLAMIAALLVAACTFAAAQKLSVPATVPLPQVRVVVAEFESPERTAFGYTVARLIGRGILNENPGIGGVYIAVPASSDQRISNNPEYIETLAAIHKASMVVWGEYYAEGDTVSIHSYVRMTPQAPMTEASFGLELNTAEGPIKASAPTMQVNFTPILASERTLREYQTTLESSRALREKPDAGARVLTPAPTIPTGTNLSLWLLESRGDWMNVRLEDNTTGWIEAGPAASPVRSAAVAEFINGTSMFIAGRYPAADKSLSGFVVKHEDDENDMNRAFMHMLLGTSRLRSMESTVPLPESETTSQEYSKAQNLIPYNPSPNDHLVIVRLLKYLPDSTGTYAFPVGALADSEDDLINSVQLDKNQQSIDNLKTYYRLAARQQFLKQPEMDSQSYQNGIQDRIGIVTSVEEEERVLREAVQIEVVTHVAASPQNMMSFNGGLWLPRDAEKSFTFKGATYDKLNATITQSQSFGGEIHYRAALSFPLYFDFAMSFWYSDYELSRQATQVNPVDSIRSANAWMLVVPTQFGLSLTLFRGLPVEPYLNAGAGATFGVSGLDVQARDSDIKEDEKSEIRFSWYFGGGADLFFTRNLAVSLSAKYQYLSFKEPMWTGQKDFTGLQLFAGITWRL